MESSVLTELTEDISLQILNYLSPSALSILSGASTASRTQTQRITNRREYWESEVISLLPPSSVPYLFVDVEPAAVYKELRMNLVSFGGRDLLLASMTLLEKGYVNSLKFLLDNGWTNLRSLDSGVNLSDVIGKDSNMDRMLLNRPDFVATYRMVSNAAKMGNDETLTELLSRGIPPMGYALYDAAESGKLSTVRLLLENSQRGHGSTAHALDLAATNESYDIAQYLLDKGNINTIDLNNALVRAVLSNQVEYVRLLLKSGRITSAYKDKCLGLARTNGYTDIADIIMSN